MTNPVEVFRALADPTRRQILEMLRARPMASGEIAERFPVAWSTISRHLAVLKGAELVLVEREGTTLRYELNTTVLQEVVRGLMDLSSSAAAPGPSAADEASSGPRAEQKTDRPRRRRDTTPSAPLPPTGDAHA